MTDALGSSVRVPLNPSRIVTLAPSLGELTSDFLGESLDKIVGVSDYTDYPKALSKVKSVGSYAHVNLESIASLKPDLIIATTDGNAPDQISHLRELGFAVLVVRTSTFNDIAQSIRILGVALGQSKLAESMSQKLSSVLKGFDDRATKRQKSGEPRRRVLVELDFNPLVVAGGSSFLNESILKVGAQNAYGDIGKPYPRPSTEDAVRRDPDVILLLGMGKSAQSYEAAARDWSRFPKMKAVKNHRVHVINTDAVVRPSMRIIEGLQTLEKAIYGS